MRTTKTIVKDFKIYLDGIEKLSRPLSAGQRIKLNRVLSTILTLLIAFKRNSGLGHVDMGTFFDGKGKRKK